MTAHEWAAARATAASVVEALNGRRPRCSIAGGGQILLVADVQTDSRLLLRPVALDPPGVRALIIWLLRTYPQPDLVDPADLPAGQRLEEATRG